MLSPLRGFLLVGFALGCFCVAPMAEGQPLARSSKLPNVLVIMADDLGFGDVSCYGATEISTPNIDRLASEGLRFTSGYCSASTCTPTRYSFLTGRYAFRQDGSGIAPPNSPAIIKPGTTTIASILKQAGYQTAVVGKWHLGLGGEGGPDWNGELKPGPLEIGFDHCLLLPTTNDRVPQVYVKDHRVLNLDPADPLWVSMEPPDIDNYPTGVTQRSTLKMDWSLGHSDTIHNGISRIGFYTGGRSARFRDEDLADKWIEESRKWIEGSKDNPFFLFFASHDIHVPRMPNERFQGKTKLGYRGDAIAELDWSVGQLLEILDRNNLTEETLVVFCSDNGPVMDDGYKDGALELRGSHRAAGPFMGGKYSVYEGGTRTPFITRWPSRIQPGVSDKIVCTIDLPASMASLAGVPLKEGECGDSFDLLAALLGDDDALAREHLVQQDNGESGRFGLRNGRWKLVRHETGLASNKTVEEPLRFTPVPKLQLFDLETDPGERHNLIDQHPEIAERMISQLEALIAAKQSRE